MTTIPKDQMDEILGYVMNQNTSNLRDLLIRNGYANASELSKSDLQIAFLKAIKDSDTFRADTAEMLTGMIIEGSKTGFVRQPGFGFVRQPGFNATGKKSGKPKGSHKLNAVPTEDDWATYYTSGAGATDPQTTTNTPAATPAKSGSFWSSLGAMATPANLSSLFNTGLGALSTSLQSKAQKSSEQNALELERIRLQQIQAQSELAANGGMKPSGLSGGAIAGIAVGGVAVLGLIIWLAVRKK